MLLSYEFILNQSFGLCIGNFFESALYQNGEYIKRSFGSDNFHVNTTIYPNKRLSALGRNCVIQIPFEELPANIEIQRPSVIELSTTSHLELLCKTNIFLTKDTFCNYLLLRVRLNSKNIIAPLTGNKELVTSIEKGRYLINLSNILLTKN